MIIEHSSLFHIQNFLKSGPNEVSTGACLGGLQDTVLGQFFLLMKRADSGFLAKVFNGLDISEVLCNAPSATPAAFPYKEVPSSAVLSVQQPLPLD